MLNRSRVISNFGSSFFGFRFLGMLSGIFVMGCLPSPLMSHAAAPSGQSAEAEANRETASECPISFAATQMCGAIDWINPPAVGSESLFNLKVWKVGSGSINGPYAKLDKAPEIFLWMPAMGHGSSPITVTQMIQADQSSMDGVYQASRVYFFMPGHWEIHIQVQENDVTAAMKIPKDL